MKIQEEMCIVKVMLSILY